MLGLGTTGRVCARDRGLECIEHRKVALWRKLLGAVGGLGPAFIAVMLKSEYFGKVSAAFQLAPGVMIFVGGVVLLVAAMYVVHVVDQQEKDILGYARHTGVWSSGFVAILFGGYDFLLK